MVPKRADTKALTLSSSWSSKALNSSSDLAKANVSLPVAGLIFIGGFTLNDLSTSANLGLLIKSSLSTPAFSSSSSLWSRVSVICCSSIPVSKSSTGSTNIRNVKSISLNSFFGNPRPINVNNLYVKSTSLTQ